MVLKSKINGHIKCYCDEDVRACRRLLAKYHIPHSVDGVTIGICADIKVTPFFDREGFRSMIIETSKKYGEPKLDIYEITEEKEDEDATRLLRQGRKAPWEET